MRQIIQVTINREALMPKVPVGRSIIDGTDQVRLYHTRMLLSKKRLPIVEGNVHEVASWAFLLNQREVAEDIRRQPVQAEGSMKLLFPTGCEGEEVHAVITAVMDLAGVEYCAAAGYTLVVFRGKMFTWEEIEAEILVVLSSYSIDIESVNREV